MHRNEILFYVFGIGAAVSAVLFTFIGLKVKGFPGKATPLVVIWFVVFVGGAATFSVLHAQDVEAEKAHEDSHASEIDEEDAEDIEATEGAEEIEAEEHEGEEQEGKGGPEASTGGSTLQLAADSSGALAYDTTELTTSPGEVTIDFNNPAPLAHDVAVVKDGKEIAATEVITEAEDSLSANLKAGDYTFLCTVPGHAAAGMEGTLKVE